MERGFAQKLKSFLFEIGLEENIIDGVDVSFLTENSEFVEWFNGTSSDNYITEHEVNVVVKLKKENKFIKSEEEIDNILLNEFSINVNDINFNEDYIEDVKNNHIELDATIAAYKQLDKLYEKQIEDSKNEIENLKKKLEYEELVMKDLVLKYDDADKTFSDILHKVNCELNFFYSIMNDNFVAAKPINNFFMLARLDELDIICKHFKEKVLRDIQNLSTFASGGHISESSFYFDHEVTNQSELNKLIVELSILRRRLNETLYQNILLEAEEIALTDCLNYMSTIDIKDFVLLKTDLNNYNSDHDDKYTKELLRNECSKWAECKIIKVILVLNEMKITSRNEKLTQMDKFLELIQKHCAILDFVWMLFKMEEELMDSYNSTIYSLVSSLTDLYKDYLNRMELMKPDAKDNFSRNLSESVSDFFKKPSIVNRKPIDCKVLEELDKSKNDISIAHECVIKMFNNMSTLLGVGKEDCLIKIDIDSNKDLRNDLKIIQLSIDDLNKITSSEVSKSDVRTAFTIQNTEAKENILKWVNFLMEQK